MILGSPAGGEPAGSGPGQGRSGLGWGGSAVWGPLLPPGPRSQLPGQGSPAVQLEAPGPEGSLLNGQLISQKKPKAPGGGGGSAGHPQVASYVEAGEARFQPSSLFPPSPPVTPPAQPGGSEACVVEQEAPFLPEP